MPAKPLWTTLICASVLASCDSGGTIAGVGRSTADVRVLNASTTNIDLLQDQTADPGNTDIVFGAGSLCMSVDVISHGLSVRPAGVRTTNSVLPSFSPNERYVVLVTGSANSLQPVSFRNSFTPATGKAGVRLINVSGAGSYDIFVTDPAGMLGAATASNVVSGTASSYFNVLAATQQVRLTTTGSTLVAFDVGNVTLAAGTRAVIALAPPAAGTTSARPFVFQLLSGGSC